MKSVNCSDLGLECDFPLAGNSCEDMLYSLLRHASLHHDDLLEMLTEKDVEKLAESIRKLIRQPGEKGGKC